MVYTVSHAHIIIQACLGHQFSVYCVHLMVKPFNVVCNGMNTFARMLCVVLLYTASLSLRYSEGCIS